MTKNNTFQLYFNQSIFCLIKIYENILGRASEVPEVLRNTAISHRIIVAPAAIHALLSGQDPSISASTG
jgi:hypothetical protein